MTFSFNLVHQPWIPCIQSDGRAIELGLQDVLIDAHQLREVYGESPLVSASLYRLLLSILHRVFGPESYAEWGVLWQGKHWPAALLKDYFDRWAERFDLFDPERPFYQASDARVKPKSVISLIHHLSSGNNPTLFDHHTEVTGVTLSPAQAARVVVTAQAFGLAGLSGLPQKYTDGTCARGVLFVVEGNNLFETLALNLIRYPDESVMGTSENDRPAWEMDDAFLPERTLPLGYLDYLTWQNRRVLLLPENEAGEIVIHKMTTAPGLRLDATVLDPMKHYHKREEAGYLALRFNEDRALWRDSVALFRLRDLSKARPPVSFHWLAELVDGGHLNREMIYRHLALGMANHQAKVFFYRHERMPLPLAYLRDEKLVEHLASAVEVAEATARQLRGALYTLAKLTITPAADDDLGHQPDKTDVSNLVEHWDVQRHFWGNLELNFWTLVENLPHKGPEALADWRSALKTTARQTFQQAETIVGTEAHRLRAAVRARGQLEAGLAKVLNEQLSEE